MKKEFISEKSYSERTKLEVAEILSNANQELREKLSSLTETDALEQITTMLDSLEYVFEKKREIFELMVEKYSDFLSQKNNLSETHKEIRTDNEKAIERYQKDQGRTLIASGVIFLLLPAYIPVIAAFGVARIVGDKLGVKYHSGLMKKSDHYWSLLEDVQDELYAFTCHVREDYHNSKDDYDPLKEKVLKGENILPVLLSQLSPERYHLEKETEELKEEKEEKVVTLRYL